MIKAVTTREPEAFNPDSAPTMLELAGAVPEKDARVFVRTALQK
jgi:hypothetical protein